MIVGTSDSSDFKMLDERPRKKSYRLTLKEGAEYQEFHLN